MAQPADAVAGERIGRHDRQRGRDGEKHEEAFGQPHQEFGRYIRPWQRHAGICRARMMERDVGLDVGEMIEHEPELAQRVRRLQPRPRRHRERPSGGERGGATQADPRELAPGRRTLQNDLRGARQQGGHQVGLDQEAAGAGGDSESAQ